MCVCSIDKGNPGFYKLCVTLIIILPLHMTVCLRVCIYTIFMCVHLSQYKYSVFTCVICLCLYIICVRIGYLILFVYCTEIAQMLLVCVFIIGCAWSHTCVCFCLFADTGG